MDKLNIYIRSIVYGGVDGIITMFNIISGVTGAKLNPKIIIILGLATLCADAISMGFSDYLSTHANNQTSNAKENPIKNGIITFISFILFGLIPLATFFILLNNNSSNIWIKSYISTIISLIILGTVQSKFTKEKWYKSAITVSLYGSVASIVSYYIGKTIGKIVL